MGKVWLVVVALPLDGGREVTSVVSADEQVDSNERMLGVHVATGGLSEGGWMHVFASRLRRRGLSTPDWHLF